MKQVKITCTGAGTLDIDQIQPFQGNLKELSRAAYKKLRKAIEDYGFSFPVFVWRKDGKFLNLDGHQRIATLKTMQAEGWEIPPLPVAWIDALDEKEAKTKLLLAVGQYGETTYEGLNEFINVSGLDLALLKDVTELPGIDFDRYDANFGHDKGAGDEIADPQDEKAEELLLLYKVQNGQIWKLGDHRLFCGDCRDAEGMRRLFGDERAVLLNTDPPYGIAYDNTVSKPDGHQRKTAWEEIENDDLVNENIQPFLEDCFRVLKTEALAPNAAWYLWHANLTGAFFAAAAAAAAADILLHRQIIWKKPRFIIGMGMYHWAHENCYMGWSRGHKPPWYGERNQTSVWEIDYDGKKNPTDRIHPTQKPVELFRIPILNHTKPGEICAEPFSGSGSQIIAAELTGRRCFASEISEKFVAVTIDRWVKQTGKIPEIMK